MNDLDLAKHLMHTCYMMYKLTPTGLAPELVHFSDTSHSVKRRQHSYRETSSSADSQNLVYPLLLTPLLWKNCLHEVVLTVYNCIMQDEVGGGHFSVKQSESHNLLRPETVESLFILWRITGDPRYRNWGWQIFRAIEMHARLPDSGYSSLDSVLSVPAPRRDSTDSFFMAETLKYILLLFSSDEVGIS